MTVKTASGPRAYALGQQTPEWVLPLIGAPLTMTDALLADGFIVADTSYRWKVDLLGVTQVRLTAAIKVVSASASSPKLQLRASLTDTTTVASMLIMGETSVEVSLFTGTVGTVQDSGWINILGTYQTNNVWLGLMNIGGDGTADPVVNMVTAQFR